MNHHDIQNAQVLIAQTMKRFGLGDFTTLLEESFATADGLRLVLVKPFGGFIHTHADLAEKIKEIQKSILNSDLVYDRIKVPNDIETKKLNQEIVDLKSTVEILQRYKVHYEMQMILQHGTDGAEYVQQQNKIHI